ncbi:MarR family winged helix-turn-helix transcriptional regulator [Pseudomonas sp. LS-2]|jgi:DNA-binding MarR family transcriptional regulator|uniref:MarR family winged helix-turn-helix transcriptional regulator n=1 Tax=Pseudomonas sp. LS-2 TaxID=2315859 RepID=UPI000E71C8BA|nr:MarR family transcriptional regulator [Pseudomonas sp. LS-2]RJX78210.1 MarR family transcriptional regulator [Pseudomonas sp. LS-2]
MAHFTPESFNDSLLGMLVGRTEQLKNRILDKHLEPQGVTAQQFKVLIMIARFCAETPADLCRMLSLDSGSMTRMLDRLEQKDLLVRTRSESDRRQVRLVLTDSGQALSDLLPQIGAMAMNEMVGMLEDSELATLEKILTKILVASADPITLARLAEQ